MQHSLAPRPFEICTPRHRLWLFSETEPLWRTLEHRVAAARRRVWLATYIYRSDRLGCWFAELLEAAAARGADTRLIYDPQGSHGTDHRLFEALRSRGVQVRAYRPWRLAPNVWRYWPREHGRLLIIDDVAFTGGVNWGAEWLPASRGGGNWHDVHVGVAGPCVKDFCRAFCMRWSEAAATGRVRDYVSDERSEVVLIADSPESAPLIFRRLCDRIERARRRVWMENSYCIPPRKLIDGLSEAALRGLDVRIITPNKTDLPIVETITRGEYHRWLASGIKVFEYLPNVLHSKVALIDDDWGTVGSFNAMTPGLWWANEANLIVHDLKFVARLAEVFLADLARSAAVTTGHGAMGAWQRSANRIYRLLEAIGTRVSPLRRNQQ